MLFVFPFAVVDTGRTVFWLDRLNSKSKAYPVGNLTKIFSGSKIIIEFLTVNSVSVNDKVVMDMLFVNVGRDYDLTIIAERFSRKGSANLMSKFR